MNNENKTPDSVQGTGLAGVAGSASFMRGYKKGYQAGLKRGRKEVVAASPKFYPRPTRIEDETGNGYTCARCGIQRPSTWYVYEIERDGQWVTPCCAMCARETKSRGPFPPNDANEPTTGS